LFALPSKRRRRLPRKPKRQPRPEFPSQRGPASRQAIARPSKALRRPSRRSSLAVRPKPRRPFRPLRSRRPVPRVPREPRRRNRPRPSFRRGRPGRPKSRRMFRPRPEPGPPSRARRVVRLLS
jgi:hypothetical protein